MARSRNYCFTLNNYSEVEYNQIIESDYKYLVIGKETGKNNTPHLQGYIEFANAKKLKTLKKLNSRIHWEIRKGTAKEASDYCKKDKNYIEHGQLSQQGKRNDLNNIKNIIKTTGKVRNAIEECTSYQQLKFAESYIKYKEPERNFKPFVIWIYGPTGSGKTRISNTISEYVGDTYWSGKSLKWWDGYDANDLCIIDDFRKDFCTFHELLRILDRYPYRIEVKGASRQLLSKMMIITTAYHPETIYNTREDVEQLIRRINIIINT